jgi:hypothetical protein
MWRPLLNPAEIVGFFFQTLDIINDCPREANRQIDPLAYMKEHQPDNTPFEDIAIWRFNRQPFAAKQIGQYECFVYLLTDRETGRWYIGKKSFWSWTTLPTLKGTKRKREKVVESSWLDYDGSNAEMQKLIAERGRDRSSREILHLCRRKSEMVYHDARLQFDGSPPG